MPTLYEIKQMVENPGKREKVPTAKYLQENGRLLVNKSFGMDAEIQVYQCGYAVYRLGKHVTVFPVHVCGDYLYLSCGEILCIRERYLDCQEWYVRLVLEGEDRISHNRESLEQEKNISYSAVSEEWQPMTDEGQTPLDRILARERVGELMGLLTERQRLVISQFFFCRKTQKEIAKELGVAAPVISKMISSSIRKIRKKHPMISSSVPAEEGEKIYAR